MKPSIWTGIYANLSLHDAMRELRSSGWRNFEVSTEHLVAIEKAGEPKRLVAAARACMARLRLSAPQAHALLGADVAHPDEHARKTDMRRLRKHLRLAASLGVRVVVIHPGGETATARYDGKRVLKRNIEAFKELGDLAAELGLRIGLENLMRKDFVSSEDMLSLLEAIGHPALGLTLDTSHANAAKVDMPAMIRKIAPYLIATHISDNDGSGDQHRVPGSGRIDWAAVMAAFGQIKYKGLFNLEIPGERHPMPVLQRLKIEHAHRVACALANMAHNSR